MNGIGNIEIVNWALQKFLVGAFYEEVMGNGNSDVRDAFFLEVFGGLYECATGGNKVVGDEGFFAFYLAVDADDFDLASGVVAFFVDDGDGKTKGVGGIGGFFEGADVRGDDDIGWGGFGEVLEVERSGGKVGNLGVEEALDGFVVEIKGDDATRIGGLNKVGDDFGGERFAFAEDFVLNAIP